MEPMQIAPTVWQLPFPVGHVYCVRLPDGFGLVDTGLPGCAGAVLDGLKRLGAPPAAVRGIVLTHSHVDHMGSAADLAEVTGARVLAGRADAPAVRGDAPEPEPVYTEAERALHEQVLAGIAADGPPPLRHVPVDREQAVASFRRLAALDDVETVCVPHGEPVLRDGAAALRAATPEADWL
jgi:glyoxylase-like metal-dependent hydrolase (beta-lactamase superfamily II)